MLRLEAKQKMLFTVSFLIFLFLQLITESRNLNVGCYISSVKISRIPDRETRVRSSAGSVCLFQVAPSQHD